MPSPQLYIENNTHSHTQEKTKQLIPPHSRIRVIQFLITNPAGRCMLLSGAEKATMAISPSMKPFSHPLRWGTTRFLGCEHIYFMKTESVHNTRPTNRTSDFFFFYLHQTWCLAGIFIISRLWHSLLGWIFTCYSTQLRTLLVSCISLCSLPFFSHILKNRQRFGKRTMIMVTTYRANNTVNNVKEH